MYTYKRIKTKKIRRKFSIVVASRVGENFRSWWWRSVSSPLQVSGAVTRLTVDRAASHFDLDDVTSPEKIFDLGSDARYPLLCKFLAR